MLLIVDPLKGKHVAERLYQCFTTTGIHGRTDMPEDLIPAGATKSSLDHLLFVTLTGSIDYQRDALALLKSARTTFADTETRYLFDPKALAETPPQQIRADMRRYGLSKKPVKDAFIWRTVGVTFFKKWESDPRNFLADCAWNARVILERLRNDTHLYAGRAVPDYPYLRGAKIGPLWLRMLRDNVGIEESQGLDRVPIPVDIHVARATLMTGVVRGQASGKLTDVFEKIREAWFQSVEGLYVLERPMIALDVDEPLWHLSKYGCALRDKATGSCSVRGSCEVNDYCVDGIVRIEKSMVEIDT